MAIVGYARVSTADQNLQMQIDELKKYGCGKIYSDKASGAKSIRKGLDQCLENLNEGDTLVVWRLDRLGRSMSHLVSVVTELKEIGVGFKSICDGAIDTTTASGELIFNIFASLAQFERELIRERTRAGLESARARGRMGGRKKMNANDSRVMTAKKLHEENNLPIIDICRTLKISKSTLYRWLDM